MEATFAAITATGRKVVALARYVADETGTEGRRVPRVDPSVGAPMCSD